MEHVAPVAAVDLQRQEQDSVRLLAVASLANAGSSFGEHAAWTTQYWLPIVKDGSTDMSWYVYVCWTDAFILSQSADNSSLALISTYLYPVRQQKIRSSQFSCLSRKDLMWQFCFLRGQTTDDRLRAFSEAHSVKNHNHNS